MRATSRLLESVRVTLFTRDHCGLCAKAKRELAQAWAQRPFDFNAVNIMRPEAKGWRDNYEFDIPVVGPTFLSRNLTHSTTTDPYQQVCRPTRGP
ncbi:hypothetical protein QBC47DRAFT_376068 [Echria macrotheca]|uniref:Glutaredoxin-like protein n=1 Tax=Echria macrotheca TaxID=438768 RepID=A0AAJ0BKA9_9PEZI|nr:hypothetical protein QBC47DRAFT_376068 [Echria macrotheca]